jgi:hypothetical protein
MLKVWKLHKLGFCELYSTLRDHFVNKIKTGKKLNVYLIMSETEGYQNVTTAHTRNEGK